MKAIESEKYKDHLLQQDPRCAECGEGVRFAESGWGHWTPAAGLYPVADHSAVQIRWPRAA